MTARPRTALRFEALSWAYEPVAMRLCRARAWRPAVVAAVAPRPHTRILDLGCGPGTLCRNLARTCPEAEIVGVDPDPGMLERARRAAGAGVHFVVADATALPASPPFDRPFDVCVSTLMFHHLGPDEKRAALGEGLRVLAPGGRLVVADWGPPASAAGHVAFAVTRLFDGLAVTRAHADGGFAAMLAAAGVTDFAERGRWPTAVGTLCLYTARKP
jgi:ubiquinone/menaquinone biosynthesis C-methylase UbiE